MRSVLSFSLILFIITVCSTCFATESFDFEFNSEHIKLLYSDNFGTPHQEHDRGVRRLEYFQKLIDNLEYKVSTILSLADYTLEKQITMGFSYHGVEEPVYKPEEYKVILPIYDNPYNDSYPDVHAFLILISKIDKKLKNVIYPVVNSWRAENTTLKLSDINGPFLPRDYGEDINISGCNTFSFPFWTTFRYSILRHDGFDDPGYLLKIFTSMNREYTAHIHYYVQTGQYKVSITNSHSLFINDELEWHLPETPLVWDQKDERIAFSVEKEIWVMDTSDESQKKYSGLEEYVDQLAWAPEGDVLFARERKAGRGDIVRLKLGKDDLEYRKLGIKGDDIIGILWTGDLLYLDKGRIMRNVEVDLDNITSGYYQSDLGPAYYFNSSDDYISGYFPNLKINDYSKQFLGGHETYIFIPYKDWPAEDKKLLLDTYGECFCHLLTQDTKFIFLNKTASETGDLLDLLKRMKAWPVNYDPATEQLAVISGYWGSPDIWLIN
jgi:hypothetical protein